MFEYYGGSSENKIEYFEQLSSTDFYQAVKKIFNEETEFSRFKQNFNQIIESSYKQGRQLNSKSSC
jgi:hypothetical protein